MVFAVATFSIQSWSQNDCGALHDYNQDGVIGAPDLMNLLSLYGQPLEVAEWTCGDPVNDYGYDYSTVLIGGQCWFAENLRTEHYANGDLIPGELSDSEWETAASGAQAVYGEGGSACLYGNCDEVQNLADYGRLYNWHAVDDSRGLCPSGWHVPTDAEWTLLADFLGGASIAGAPMKSSPCDTPSWDGTNSSGFSGLPGGHRNVDGVFGFESLQGIFWSASPASETFAWDRTLYYAGDVVNTNGYNQQRGHSVRCVRDE